MKECLPKHFVFGLITITTKTYPGFSVCAYNNAYMDSPRK